MTRKIVAAVLLASAAGFFVDLGIRGDHAGTLVWAALLAIAGLGLTRHSLLVQVLSRATAWSAVVFAAREKLVAHADRDLHLFGILAATIGALAVSRPLLRTPEARATFHPRVFREWFLAGAVSTATMGMFVVCVQLLFLTNPGQIGLVDGILGAFSTGLLVSAAGLLRMRAWAVLLGGGLSAILVSLGLLSNDPWLAMLGLPALLMQVLPVIVARRRSKSGDLAERSRVEDTSGARSLVDAEPSRVGADPSQMEDEAAREVMSATEDPPAGAVARESRQAR